MSIEREWLRGSRSHLARRKDEAAKPAQSDLPSHAPALAKGGVSRRLLRALGPQVGNRILQRLASDGEFAASDKVERAIETQRGGGAPLEHGVRSQMEGAMGADLSGVRVHSDEQAATLNQDLSARAFTQGKDIFFGAGEYAPETGAGQRLLAHELTHVMQQRDGAQLMVGAANDPAEKEADAVADRVVQRLGSIDRQAEEEEEEELMPVRRQDEEEEEAQMLRRQDLPEEEEAQMLRRQDLPEEEEAQMLRRQDLPEEEEAQMLRRQDLPEEEEAQMLRRQEVPEEEEETIETLRRQDEEEEDELVQARRR